MLCDTLSNSGEKTVLDAIESTVSLKALALREQEQLHSRNTPTVEQLAKDTYGKAIAVMSIKRALDRAEVMAGLVPINNKEVSYLLVNTIIEEHPKVCLHQVIEALHFGSIGKYPIEKLGYGREDFSINYKLINHWICRYTDEFYQLATKS